MDLSPEAIKAQKQHRAAIKTEVESYLLDWALTFNTPHGDRILTILKEAFYSKKMVGTTEYGTTVLAAQHDVVGFILENIERSRNEPNQDVTDLS